MAHLTGYGVPTGLSDTTSGTDVFRPGEVRGFSPVGAQSVTFPVVTAGGCELTVTLASRPVFNLENCNPVGLRVTRTVRRAGGESALVGAHRIRLDASDLKRIDVESLRHGVGLLDLSGGTTGVLPAFWRTVASSRGRFALLYTGLQSDVEAGLLLVEIMGVDARADPAVVREAIGHLEAQRRGVIINVPPDEGMIARVAQMNPLCISVDFSGVETESAAQWQAAAALIACARAVVGRVMVVNLPPARGEAAAVAGATHGTFCDMPKLTV